MFCMVLSYMATLFTYTNRYY